MKNLLIIALVLGLGLSACSKEEESPNPTTKTTTTPTGGSTGGGGGGGGSQQPNLTTSMAQQFWGKIDGNVVTFIDGSTTVEAMYDKDSTIGADSTTASYIASLLDDNFKGIEALRGELKYLNGGKPTEAQFLGLFTNGMYPYSTDVIEIRYYESLFSQFTTAGGDQTGSKFELTQMTTTGTATAPKCRTVIKFNCKVYNTLSPSLSKTITEGIMMLEFNAD